MKNSHERQLKKGKSFVDRLRKFQVSTKVLVSNILDQSRKHKEILEIFEDTYIDIHFDDDNKIDSSAEPINILVLDGGGMKG